MLDFSSRKSDTMHNAETAPDMLRSMIAADRPEHGLERAIERAARACVLSYRRTRAILYAEAKRLWADEEMRIREAYEVRMEREMSQLDVRRAVLQARLEALRSTHEAALAQVRAVEELHVPVRPMEGATVDRRRELGGSAG